MTNQIDSIIIYADIVGYSRIIEEERERIKDYLDRQIYFFLPEYVFSNPLKRIFYQNTGDGFLLAVPNFGDKNTLMMCFLFCLYLSHRFSELPTQTKGTDIHRVRFGLHKGDVEYFSDSLSLPQVRGNSLTLGRRVLDFGGKGHILTSRLFFEELIGKHQNYFNKKGCTYQLNITDKILNSLELPIHIPQELSFLKTATIVVDDFGDYVDKHGNPISIQNVFCQSEGNNIIIGNRTPPIQGITLIPRGGKDRSSVFQIFQEEFCDAQEVRIVGITNEQIIKILQEKEPSFKKLHLGFITKLDHLKEARKVAETIKKQESCLNNAHKLKKNSYNSRLEVIEIETLPNFTMTEFIFQSEAKNLIRLTFILEDKGQDIKENPVLEIPFHSTPLYSGLSNLICNLLKIK